MTEEQLRERLRHPLSGVELEGFGPLQRGKVRDAYLVGDSRRLLITTDRISAFDRVLGTIPFRGQVLNQLTNWWLERTRDLVDNHLLAEVHPNVVLVRDAQPLPIEVVVRAYLTGSSKTALWTLYEKGQTGVYGLELPP
ncbi:MAG: phosphoribosylaminoimidazolesuccinocarboxamide synthase, partial [Candidatus Eremiobacteraeota bacterium]|nr:phosphoribosylaminoimidazolesuccinocarboxamide synthase [Candidatus Eremiobacteraeota bacterium]